jgi:hypothetical protein
MPTPSERKITGHADTGGDGEINFLDEETRQRAIECIRSRGRITITSTKVAGQAVRSGDWAQQID